MAKTVRKSFIGLEDVKVGIGTFSRGTSTGGTQTLTKINLNGLLNTITSVSSTPYSVTAGGLYLVNASSAAITMNLPTAIGNDGMIILVKKTDLTANAVTLDGSGSQTIDQSLTWVLNVPLEIVRIISDGSNWQII